MKPNMLFLSMQQAGAAAAALAIAGCGPDTAIAEGLDFGRPPLGSTVDALPATVEPATENCVIEDGYIDCEYYADGIVYTVFGDMITRKEIRLDDNNGSDDLPFSIEEEDGPGEIRRKMATQGVALEEATGSLGAGLYAIGSSELGYPFELSFVFDDRGALSSIGVTLGETGQ